MNPIFCSNSHSTAREIISTEGECVLRFILFCVLTISHLASLWLKRPRVSYVPHHTGKLMYGTTISEVYSSSFPFGRHCFHSDDSLKGQDTLRLLAKCDLGSVSSSRIFIFSHEALQVFHGFRSMSSSSVSLGKFSLYSFERRYRTMISRLNDRLFRIILTSSMIHLWLETVGEYLVVDNILHEPRNKYICLDATDDR